MIYIIKVKSQPINLNVLDLKVDLELLGQGTQPGTFPCELCIHVAQQSAWWNMIGFKSYNLNQSKFIVIGFLIYEHPV